jgi:hypothetical protein
VKTAHVSSHAVQASGEQHRSGQRLPLQPNPTETYVGSFPEANAGRRISVNSAKSNQFSPEATGLRRW